MSRTVVHFTDSKVFGGAEQAMLQLMSGLQQWQWRSILFYSPTPELLPLVEKARGLGLQLCEVPRIDRLQDSWRLPQVIRALRRERPAIFHAHLNWQFASKYGLAAAVLANVPALVASVHLFADISDGLVTTIQRHFMRTQVDQVLAVSQDMAHCMAQTLRVPQAQVQVVHNGICVSEYEDATVAARAPQRKTEGGSIVLVPARLDLQKGHSYLIEAASILPDVTFLLAGDGAQRATLEKQARRLNVEARVRFLGYRKDMARLYARSDVVVLPSLYEGLPLALLEAMAGGKPVVATQIDGVRELVLHEETGLLVPPGDPLALATAIRRLLDQPSYAQRLAVAGRARVREQFTVEAMTRRVAHVYETLASAGEVK